MLRNEQLHYIICLHKEMLVKKDEKDLTSMRIMNL